MKKDVVEHMRKKWSDEDCLEKNMNFETDSFFVTCYDRGGFGPCESSFYGTLSFTSPSDFLGYLRFFELRRILSYWAGKDGNMIFDLEKLCSIIKDCDWNEFRGLAESIETAIRTDVSHSDDQFKTALQNFNDTFNDSNPSVQYTNCGDLKEHFIKSKFLESMLCPNMLRDWANSETNFAPAAQFIIRSLLQRCEDLEQLFLHLDFDDKQIRSIIIGWMETANE